MKIGSYEINVPFVTTSSDKLKTLHKLVDIAKGQSAVDLGSGDGRIVLEFAKQGAIVHGYEFQTALVSKAKQRIKDANLEDKIIIFEKSFWDVSLTNYDLVYIYGMNSIMGRLEQKLESELKPGSKFISNIFKLPHWKPKKIENQFYLYIKS